MPRRRRDPATEMLEDVVDTVVGTAFDRAGEAFRKFREQQKERVPEASKGQQFVCAACRENFALAEVEMVHPTNGFSLCQACFQFMWKAGAEKLKLLGQRTAAGQSRPKRPEGQARRPSAAAGTPPSGPPPWEILGCKKDASEDEVKRAYRDAALKWHPDRIHPSAPADDHLIAKQRFQEIQRAYKVMMSVRQPPEGP